MKLNLGEFGLAGQIETLQKFLVLLLGVNLMLRNKNMAEGIHHNGLNAKEGDTQLTTLSHTLLIRLLLQFHVLFQRNSVVSIRHIHRHHHNNFHTL